MSEQHDNGGELGSQLDRLRLVTEELQAMVAAQRADGTAGEKWLARVSSLETRISMAESTMRAEAERVTAAAKGIDALAGTLRGALDGAEAIAGAGRELEGRLDRIDAALAAATPDMQAWAAAVGRQVEATIEAPNQAMTSALDQHLERSSERERAVATALEALTTQLNQFTATLASEVRRSGQEAVAASTSALERTNVQVAELAAKAVGSNDVLTRVDLAIAGIGAVRDELGALGAGLDHTARLDAIAEATNRVDARVAQTATALGQTVRDALTEDRDSTLAPVLDRLGVIDAVRNDVVGLRESLTQRLVELADRAPVDPTEALEDVSAQLLEVRHALNRTSVATLLDAVREDLDLLRTDLQASREDPAGEGLREVLAGVVARIDELRLRPDPAAALGGALEAVTQRLDEGMGAIAARLTEVSDEPDPTAELTAALGAEIRAMHEQLRERIGAIDARLTEVSDEPDPAAELGPSLQALRDEVSLLASGLGNVAEVPASIAALEEAITGLAPLPAAVDGLGGAVEGAAVVQRRTAAVIESLQEELQALRAEVGAAAAGTQHATTSMDQATARLVEATRAELAVRGEVDEQRAAALLERLAAVEVALAAVAERPADGAPLDPVLDRLAASNDAMAGLHADLDTLAGALRSVREELGATRIEGAASAERTVARLAAFDDLGEALGRIEAQGGAARERLDALLHLSSVVERLDTSLTAQTERLDASITAQSERLDGVLTAAELEEAIAALIATLSGGPTPVSPEDLHATTAAFRSLIETRPTAPTLEELVEGLQAVLPPAGVTPDQLAAALSHLRGDLPATLAPETIATAVRSALPAPASPEDIAVAVRTALPAGLTADHLAAALDELRTDVREVLSPDQVADAVRAALPEPPTADDIAAAVRSALPAAPSAEAIASAVRGVVPPSPTPEEIAGTVRATLPSQPTAEEIAGALRAALPGQVSPEEIAAAVHAAGPAPPHPDEIAAAVRATLPDPVSPEEIAAAVRATLPGQPSPEEIAAAVRATLPGQPTPEDIAAAVQAALPPPLSVDHLTAALAELRADVVASGSRADAAATASASAAERTAELRDELAAVQASVAALAAVAPDDETATGDDVDAEAMAAQVDALGRLVQHAVRSLHLIEAATVGVSPQSERSRAAAATASRDLESARRK